MQTFFHLLKGYVGPGCLSLPWAFSQLGITVGFLGTILLSFLTSYNCLSVVRVFREQMGEGEATNNAASRKEITYPDIAAEAYGAKFRTFVTFSVLTQQLAICTIFFSFIGENLISILHKLSAHDALLDKKIVAITLAVPAVLALSCIPDLRALAPVSKVGMVLLLASFLMLGGAVAENWGQHASPKVELSKVPIAMCAIMYSFEGICLVMPVEQSMKHPKKFNQTFIAAMVTVCIIFSSVGVACVMAFGAICKQTS
jgi:proton-coupled amino acid transporter